MKISKNEEKNIIKSTIETWGQEEQIEMMIEECAELIQALQKHKRAIRAGKLDLSKEILNVCDEITDVEILIKQMKLIWPKNILKNRKKFKLDRLKYRVNQFCMNKVDESVMEENIKVEPPVEAIKPSRFSEGLNLIHKIE